jgi:hypothetical protein
MKNLCVAWLMLGMTVAIPASAQEAAPGLLPASGVTAEQNRLSMLELKDLVGPIALYPIRLWR